MSQKVAYVTGGMGGIGTAICQRLHKEGFKVIAGCGPTRDHAKWLEEHGSLDNLIARAADIKGVAGQNLRDAIASGQLALSRQLVTMKTDCDLSAYIGGLPQLDAVTLGEPDSAALAPFYEKYGFKGLVRTLGAAAADVKAAKPGKAAKADSAQGGLFDADDAAATEVAARRHSLAYRVGANRSPAVAAATAATALAAAEDANPAAIKYLNRLSDWLFVAARVANDNGAQDILWVPGASR